MAGGRQGDGDLRRRDAADVEAEVDPLSAIVRQWISRTVPRSAEDAG